MADKVLEIEGTQLNFYQLANQLDDGTFDKVVVRVDNEDKTKINTGSMGGFTGLPGTGRPTKDEAVIVTYADYQTADASAPQVKFVENDVQSAYDRGNKQGGVNSMFKITRKIREISRTGDGTSLGPYIALFLKRTKNQPEPRLAMISKAYADAIGL